MSLWRRLFGLTTSPSQSAGESVLPAGVARTLDAPDWVPSDEESERVAVFARRVARELRSASLPPSREGANHWVVSYDVEEAVWYPAAPGSWAAKNGRTRDGWSQGSCLLLFLDGRLAQGQWFGEVDPSGESVGIDNVVAPQAPMSRWSSGNLSRWRQGGGGLHPKAAEHFKGFWPEPRSPLPAWAGTSAQLKRLLTDRHSQLPRYF